MKKKLGPLPTWAWIVIVGGTIAIYIVRKRSSASSTSANANSVDPSSPMGLTYAQEQQDQAAGIDPATGQTYAAEQLAATSGTAGTGGGGGALSSSGAPDPTLAAIEGDLSGINTNLALINGGQGVSDSITPAQTFTGELTDLASGVTALRALQATLTPAPVTVAAGNAASGGATTLTPEQIKYIEAGTKPPAPPRTVTQHVARPPAKHGQGELGRTLIKQHGPTIVRGKKR
ncbi:MAG TPA: hypothetical protein VFP55_13665 [Solirubrobacteraceae bacterium]|nr:hypothetical protein [Solirubrobacteraceae bacterium]